jgi:hypothetical protein
VLILKGVKCGIYYKGKEKFRDILRMHK